MSIEEVKAYYDENAQKEWERLERHPFEFLFTTYMLDRHIRPGDSVLDIGGGPGRYSVYYAKKGCRVTLVDLSEGNIALAGEKAAECGAEFERRTGNCLELDGMGLGEYDHVLLMGPLYHLQAADDRRRAVELALRHLKPGGTFACSFILDFAGLIYDLRNGPGLLVEDLKDPARLQILDSIAAHGEYDGPTFTSAYFINQTQIEPFMSRFGLEKLHLFGQEGILALNETQLKTFPQEEFDLWVETAKRFLELPEFLAFSEHAMYVGRKPAAGSAAERNL
jgi:S-adenosylmethionine-dependent methyltransferase